MLKARPFKLPAALAAVALTAALSGCTVAGNAATTGTAAAAGTVQVVIGYQSKTIDTVTAGTLLRSLGYFTQQLSALSARTRQKYSVSWQDYSTGAPITAEMLAGKIDIGSMGDYPLLINGSRSQALGGGNTTEMISVTAYNLRSALNGIVVPLHSKARTLRDLAGKAVSTSVGSAGDGLLVQALRQQGLNPATGVTTENQQPEIGASALESGSVAAMAQFADWPGLLVYQNKARLLYDGGQLDVPTFHGVVTRDAFARQYPGVVRAFLRAQLQATSFLHAHPLRAARIVSRATGVPPEVVYLYNGPNGLADFNLAIKPALRAAMAHDLPYLSAMGVLQGKPLNLGTFVNDSYVRQVLGPAYGTDLASNVNPAAITGTDPACHVKVTSAATAGEVWLAGQDTTQPAATPSCLLRDIKADQQDGHQVLAAYIPDAVTGTRWFADKDLWAEVPGAPADRRFLPFTTQAGADAYQAAHPSVRILSYAAALAAS
jgi:ABC-type nitrate/sulfonate/bicarbonate transport system substrate-binding protein